jgi:hypothetical protein
MGRANSIALPSLRIDIGVYRASRILDTAPHFLSVRGHNEDPYFGHEKKEEGHEENLTLAQRTS